MQGRPESFEQRPAELDELFGPEQAVYGEVYMERLWKDEELFTKFERGTASAPYCRCTMQAESGPRPRPP